MVINCPSEQPLHVNTQGTCPATSCLVCADLNISRAIKIASQNCEGKQLPCQVYKKSTQAPKTCFYVFLFCPEKSLRIERSPSLELQFITLGITNVY